MNQLIWIDEPIEDPIHGPECPWACPDGMASHVWRVSIEEGCLSLSTDECPICNRGARDLEPEYFGGEFSARLVWHQEVHGYYDPSYDVWVEIVPTGEAS